MQVFLENGGLSGVWGFADSTPALFWVGALCTLAAYLLGSVNFAVLFSRAFYGEDVRKKGSGNAGSTNMLRLYGGGVAMLTLVCDMAKGALAAAIGLFVMPYATGFAYVTGFCCLLGHAFPIFHHGRGGKGVASLSGVLLLLNPPLFLVLLLLFVLTVALFGYISLGSILCAVLFPLLNNFMPFWFSPVPPVGIAAALAMALLVLLLHRRNIARLLDGTESKISFHRKKT